MKRKSIIKRTICYLTTATILTVSLFKCCVGKNYVKNEKYMPLVAEKLDVDMSIMQRYKSDENSGFENLLRLKPNDSKEIYVNIDDEVSSNVKTNIKNTLSEFNNIFSSINDSYNFVVCDNKSFNVLKDNNTAITFGYSKLKSNILGEAQKQYQSFSSGNKDCYITGAKIVFNSEVFDNLSKDVQIYTIKHELLHVLGFSDIYTKNKDETSLMNVEMAGLSKNLSPNDLKMLYVSYGNKHINKDGSFNKNEMDNVKKLIDDYENTYYKHLMNILMKNYNNQFENISKEDFSFLELKKYGATIIIDNNNFEYLLNGYTKRGKIVVGDNYLILPDIKIEKNGEIYNDFLVLLKKDGKINCYNAEIIIFFDVFTNNNKQNSTYMLEK